MVFYFHQINPNAYFHITLVESIEMIRKHKLLLLVLCVSLLLFKAVTGNRFVENGLKRAEIYSDYSTFIIQQKLVNESPLSDMKNESSIAVHMHMVAIVISVGIVLFVKQSSQIMRPVVRILISEVVTERIFKPPRLA